jgi:hypothetical protein
MWELRSCVPELDGVIDRSLLLPCLNQNIGLPLLKAISLCTITNSVFN